MRTLLMLCILFYGYDCCYAQQVEHIVKRGESFSSIAKMYSISEKDLKNANSASSVCYIGRKLVIPIGKSNDTQTTHQAQDFQLQSTGSPVLTKSGVTSYQVGQALWHHHKYDAATAYLRDAAEKGESRAYYPLADCYANKESSSYSEKDAVFWLHKSATTNNKTSEEYWQSCHALALRYQSGNGVKKDLSKSYNYCSEYRRYAPQNEQRKAKVLLDKIMEEQKVELAAQEKRNAEENIAKHKQQQAATANSSTHSVRESQPERNYTQNKSTEMLSNTSRNRTYGASNRQTVQQSKTIYNRLPNDIVKYYKTNDNIVTKFSYGYQVSPYGGVSHCIVMFPGPYLIVFFGYEVYPEYFEIKDTYRWVRIARDLSWVQNYPGFLYNHPATEAEYLKFEKTYIPVPGAISSTPGSTSSGNTPRNNPSPSKGVGCHQCNNTGINPNPCTGGCLYAFRAPYTANSAGTRCSICGNGTNHHHDRCAHCNAPAR